MLKRHHIVIMAVAVVGLVAGLLWFRGNQVNASITARPLYEPDDGTSYFGFTFRTWETTDPAYGDTRVFADRLQDSITNELGGKQLSLYTAPEIWQKADGSMVDFNDVINKINLYNSFNTDSVPVISWSAQTGWDVASSSYAGITTQTINSGSLDSYIHQYAQDVKAYGKPVFIKAVCLEVNGSWNHNCSPNANASLTKSDYINAFRHVVDIFRQENVTNVTWVWTINTFPVSPVTWGIDTNFVSYYPGDNYVDWVGVDHYDYGDPANVSTNPLNVAQWLDPEYNFAVKHAKPVMIPEFGVRAPGSGLTPAQQQTWLGSMFDYFESHPKIKAVLYFNYNTAVPYSQTTDHTFLYDNQVNYAPNVNDGDHRLIAESGANFRGTFSSRVANSRYVSQLQFNTSPLPDIWPPDISITAPVNNAVVTGNVAIAATGYDAYGITRVEFYVDNTLLSTDTATPYGASWDSTTYANNSNHTMYAKAYDAAGNVRTSSSITVKVSETVPPTVSITSPADNSTVTRNATTVINASASDASGIAKVEFYVNNALKCTDTVAPYNCNWSVPPQKNVMYTLTAKAYDSANNTATSAAVSVTSK